MQEESGSTEESRFKHIKPRQLVFPERTECTHVYLNGMEDKFVYGKYEAVNIISENGWNVNRVELLAALTVLYYYVEEVTRHDGVKIIFDKPFYCIRYEEYGDGSGRKAKSIRQ